MPLILKQTKDENESLILKKMLYIEVKKHACFTVGVVITLKLCQKMSLSLEEAVKNYTE